MKISENNERFVSPRLEKSFTDFLEYHSPAFLRRNIRRMAFLYFRQSIREGIHDELSDFLDQLDMLLDFLEIAEEETKSWRTDKA